MAAILGMLRNLLPFKDGGAIPPSNFKQLMPHAALLQRLNKPVARMHGGAVAKMHGGAVAKKHGGAVAKKRGGAVAKKRGGAVKKRKACPKKAKK